MRSKGTLVKMYESCCHALLKHINLNSVNNGFIAKHLNTYCVGMYRFGVSNKKLLWQNVRYSKTIKVAVSYSLACLNINVNQAK